MAEKIRISTGGGGNITVHVGAENTKEKPSESLTFSELQEEFGNIVKLIVARFITSTYKRVTWIKFTQTNWLELLKVRQTQIILLDKKEEIHITIVRDGGWNFRIIPS